MRTSCLVVVVLLSWAAPGFTQGTLSGSTYTVKHPTFSSLGTSEVSGSFTLQATLGQSTPLRDPSAPPYGGTYEVWPGFWYAATGPANSCPGDVDQNGVVDHFDLADLAPDLGRTFCSGLCPGDLDGDDDVDGSDLEKVARDMWRIDCLGPLAGGQ